MPMPRCVLCLCTSVVYRWGYPVCAYHLEHTEDDPSCTTCGWPDYGVQPK
jgi:hypothetical protein